MKDRVLFQFAHLFKRDAYSDDGLATGVLKNLDSLDIIHKKALLDIAKIRNSRELTANGKVEAVRKLAAAIDDDLAGLNRAIVGYDDQIGRLAESIKPKRHPVDDLAWQLECREIRDHIKSLDPVEQEAFVLTALESGQEQVMESVRYAPIPFRFASSEMIEKIEARQTAMQFPEDVRKLKDLRLAAQETTSAIASVRAALGQQGVVLSRQDLSSSQAA